LLIRTKKRTKILFRPRPTLALGKGYGGLKPPFTGCFHLAGIKVYDCIGSLLIFISKRCLEPIIGWVSLLRFDTKVKKITSLASSYF
jgi:hypothetical protein